MNKTSIYAEYPLAIYVELTDRCNLACKMCRDDSTKGDVLPLSTFNQIASELFPHAVYVDLRGWGESTILPNFLEYVEMSLRYPIVVKIISNGTVRKRRLWTSLGEKGVFLGISFDGATQKTFSTLRGGARIDHVLKSIDEFVGGCIRGGYDPSKKLYFCITVSSQNLSELPDIILLGVKHRAKLFKLEPIFTSENDPLNLKCHREQVASIVNTLGQLESQLGVTIELSASLHKDIVVQEAVDKLCIHPWSVCYINARGGIGFCDHLNGRKEYTFGKWSDCAFMSFWNSKVMRELRSEHIKSVKNGNEISICRNCNWCYQRRYMDLEDWIDPSWKKYRITCSKANPESS